MKSIVAFALLGAFVLVAVEADSSSENDDEAQGLAAFPKISLTGTQYKNKLNKLVKTFNEYAGSTTAYTTENLGNYVKITGDVIVPMKNGDTPWFDHVYINRVGRFYSEIGEEIEGALGIIGGNKERLENISDSAFEKIIDSFKKNEACLSALPNDIWVFGKTTFDNFATIAADSAKMITQLGADAWDKFVPLSPEYKKGLETLFKSGSQMITEPVKIFTEGAGKAFETFTDGTGKVFDTTRKGFGIAAGVPLAAGSAVVDAGANMVSVGAGFVEQLAKRSRNFGENMAGLNKQRK